MNRLILLLLLFTGTCTAHAQNTDMRTATDSISIKKTFGGGYRLYQGGKRLNQQQLTRAMKQHQDAWKLYKPARANGNVAFALGFAGGFLVGWSVGTAIAGGDPVWEVAGVGAGLIVVAIPFGSKSDRQMKKAVDTYNSGIRTNAFRYKNELRFSTTGNSIGLALHF